MARRKLKVLKVHIMKNWIRLRIRNPKRYAACRNVALGTGGKRKIVCCPKGRWNAKTERCRAPMELQAILKPR